MTSPILPVPSKVSHHADFNDFVSAMIEACGFGIEDDAFQWKLGASGRPDGTRLKYDTGPVAWRCRTISSSLNAIEGPCFIVDGAGAFAGALSSVTNRSNCCAIRFLSLRLKTRLGTALSVKFAIRHPL